MQKPSTNTALLVASAFTALIALPSFANAQAPAQMPTFQAEKCYGVNSSRKNDCASSGNNSCGGSAARASDPKAWIYVPAGTCAKIQGGSTTPKA